MFERGHIITGNNAEPQFTPKGGIKRFQCNINAPERYSCIAN